MAFTFDATVGGSAATSYVSVSDADDYFGGRLNVSAWTAAVTATKQQALSQASKILDREEYEGEPVLPLSGTSTDTTQALKWPRYSADDDAGWVWESTVIPQCVKDAACEVALYLLNQGTTDPTQPTGLEGFENVKVGSLEVKPRHGHTPDGLPSHIRRILAPVLRTSRGMIRLTRG